MISDFSVTQNSYEFWALLGGARKMQTTAMEIMIESDTDCGMRMCSWTREGLTNGFFLGT